ncbi:P-loop containing nucleoside triphosphate hydrolase protein [Gongronella butleri]|nr:P-loop containing nucleoside triphosphate hydrolase protein [Gongronella butleri]
MTTEKKDTVPPYDLAIDVENLNFSFGGPAILEDVNLKLKPGSRCILVGANGAGKTTLLRILGGKRMIKSSHVNVLGKNVFTEVPNATYLGTEWLERSCTRSDLAVDYLLYSMGSQRWPERTHRLLEVLDIDLKWRLHQVSDGQRRRVQLLMGLLQPWDLLLLDEVTVDLDILVRSDFLQFLKEETEERGATIVYATHIFDGLGDWPTHVAHVTQGTIVDVYPMDTTFTQLEIIKEKQRQDNRLDSPLTELCYKWLRADRDVLRHTKPVPINPDTGLPFTRWDELKENMKQYQDRYYNYWHR